MIYTVNYTKANSFMKAPKLKNKKLDNGEEIENETRYMQPSMPRSFRVYSPPLSYKKKTYLIDCNQEELNNLVKEMGFYDDMGNHIVTAPMKNANAPFWRHPDLRLVISNGGTTLDDEVPLDKFWLLCFRADPRFKMLGEKLAPALDSKVEYTVAKISDKIGGADESLDETFKAMKLLTSNSDNLEKLTSILAAMGVDVKNPNENLVTKALTKKITTLKDVYVQGTSERNIEMFIRLAETPTKDLQIKGLITKARKRGMIRRNSSNIYIYGDFKMGTSLQKVEDFLNHPDHVDVLNELLTKTKD